MRERLIPQSFYIIMSEESEFEVEKLGKVYGELKKGSKHFQNKSQKSKNAKKWNVGGGRGGAQRHATVRNGAQASFPW